jgi:hypothetical protein
MRRSHFTEAQIIGLIKEQGAGLPTPELCRKHGLSPSTFYKLGQQALPGLQAHYRRGPHHRPHPLVRPGDLSIAVVRKRTSRVRSCRILPLWDRVPLG